MFIFRLMFILVQFNPGLLHQLYVSVFGLTGELIRTSRHCELAEQPVCFGTLTDLEDSSEPEDSVSLLLRLLELRYGEDDGESSM